ncbi:hypothetical protein [Streptomyces sp. NPDC048577]|uniref:hypothetical protein n=1 Tax=Streptomyces sp. NPDC048577 TaxID=3157209 RepID=UPI00342C03A8
MSAAFRARLCAAALLALALTGVVLATGPASTQPGDTAQTVTLAGTTDDNGWW